MPKTINHGNKAKIYHPKGISPQYATNIITANKTLADGSVQNESEANAVYAREWVDENQK